jgi:hypothetical protein
MAFVWTRQYVFLFFIKKNPTRYNMYQNVIVTYLYETQHVSGDTPPIIRNLKLHWQPLVFHTWKVVARVVDNVHQLHVQQPFMYEKLEAASAVLSS